jgi:hypothetical protein
MATKPKTKAETVPPSVKDLDPTDPKLTKAIVERLRYLKERRKRLEAEAREFATEEDQLVDVVMAWMEKKEVHSTKMHGYQITQVEGRAFPKWKDAYTEIVGIGAATKFAQAATRSVSIQIQPVPK